MARNSYQSVKRRYFSALNIASAKNIASSVNSEPKSIPIPLPDENVCYPSSCPIPVPSEETNPLKLSTGSFIPPHLYGKKNDSFSMYDYDQKRKRCKNAF